MEDAIEPEKLFKLSNNHYLHLERNIPAGWMYTLYDEHLNAIAGGDIDQFYITAWKAGKIALVKMEMRDISMSECHLTLRQLLS